MTNQKWFRSIELADMLEYINQGILNEHACIIDAITEKYSDCPDGISCSECIKNWLKAEKEDNS